MSWIRVAGVLAALIACFAVLFLGEHYFAENYFSVVDDTLISMQYARNLAHGHGLVFNVGERVEGYTNFLWVVLMVPLYALSQLFGGDFVAWTSHLDIGIAAVNMLFVYLIGRRLWADDLLATVVALGLCVVDNSYVVWAALGLEGHLLAFWLLLAVWLALSSRPHRGAWIGFALAFAHMTRPDAGLFNVFLLAGLGAEWLLAPEGQHGAGERRARKRVLVQSLATWLVVYGLYFAWRYHYYGWLFPNTYYAKVGGGGFDGWARGLDYLERFLRERRWVPLAAVFALFGTTRHLLRAIVLYLLCHTLYVVAVGGDYFAGARFFVPQIPLFALAIAAAVHVQIVSRLARGPGPHSRRSQRVHVFAQALGFAAASLVLFRMYQLGVARGPYKHEILGRRGLARLHRNFMSWLSVHKPPDATIAAAAIGSSGFDGNFVRVVDMLGIIDPVLAHQRVDNFGHGEAGHEKIKSLDDILAQRPTYIADSVYTDLWWRGYYFDASMRMDLLRTVEGIWRRDELLDRGEYLHGFAFHFDLQEGVAFTAAGSAFEHWPSTTRPKALSTGVGERGAYVSSFHETLGDRATGQLVSREFALVGDEMVLRVGGAADPEHVLVALQIDGKRVFAATGCASDQLSRRKWHILPYRGRRARLQIIDDSMFGHILVDEVIQWRKTRR